MSTLYASLMRPVLFHMDPETVHGMTLRACAMVGRSALLRRVVRSRLRVASSSLEQTIAGIHFENPIGLAAGFDKNGVAFGMLGALGFGHVEIGSISAYPSEGNSRPRLFRIPQDEGIVVHYGVPNAGADVVAERIQRSGCPVPLGVNLVKTNDPRRPATDDEVLGDYATAFGRLQSSSSYINLNLSCPNSANDRNYFDEIPKVHALLQRLADQQPRVPVFLKLKPTADRGFLSELVAVTDQFGFVAGFGINLPAGKPADLRLTMSRDALSKQPGAVSGRPVENLINANLQLLYQVIGPGSRYKLMAAGGVFSAQDAYRKIRLGASLVQLYTAVVYHGPGVVKEILRGLVILLERDKFGNVAEAVGVDLE
jgi:dihydroorotate dehydrogenase